MQNIYKDKEELKEIFKRQIITILWGILLNVALTFLLMANEDMNFKEVPSLPIYESVTGGIVLAFISTLYLNAKFKEWNLKNILIKIVVSSCLAFIGYNILLLELDLSSRSTECYLALFVVIILSYYHLKLKEGENLKKLIIKTLSYMTYGMTCYLFLTILAISVNILILKDIHIYSKFYLYFYLYLYNLVAVLFFIIFQEDKKEYNFDKKDLIFKIFKFFLIALVILMYTNIFLYGRTKFYIITHFIFWTGYLILIINIALKNKKIAAIMLPLSIFLVYKISERINELGLTEGRYFILVFGILLLLMYLIQFLKPQIQEKNYVILVIISIFIAVFMPKVNAFDMSKKNLSVRANKLADELRIKMENGVQITNEEAQKIRDYFYYFSDRHYTDNFMDLVRENENLFLEYSFSKDEEVQRYINSQQISEKGIDITGYDKIYKKEVYYYKDFDEIENNEDYKMLEKIFVENKEEIIDVNRKIIVDYADIIYNSEKNLYTGQAQIFILEKTK